MLNRKKWNSLTPHTNENQLYWPVLLCCCYCCFFPGWVCPTLILQYAMGWGQFQDTSVGSGKVQPKVKVTPPPKAQQNTSSPISKTSPKTATPKVLTRGLWRTVVKKKRSKKKTPETRKPAKKPAETPKKIKPEPPKPKVDASTKNVLSNAQSKPQSTPTTQGEGDREAGDKGKQRKSLRR